MANISFGQNILPKTDNTYSLGNSSYKWHAYLADINGTAIEDLVLPTVDSTDSGKILGVSSGNWAAITPNYLTSHQDITGKADKDNTILTGSLSLGRKTSTSVGTSSVALGVDTTASGTASHAEGYYTVASGNYSHAEGERTAETATVTIDGTSYTVGALDRGSHVEGRDCVASYPQAHAEGYQCYALHYQAHAEGYLTKASGEDSHAEGYSTIASGAKAHAEGWGGTWTDSNNNSYTSGSIGIASHSEGYQTISGGYGTPGDHAEGFQTRAVGGASHTEGFQTYAQGSFSHAEGYKTQANNYAHAEGNTSIASAESTHAEGQETLASVAYAHSEGFQTIAAGMAAHAEGYGGTHTEDDVSITPSAAGMCDHIEGYQTRTASPTMPGNHAEGFRTAVIGGGAAHAEGMCTIANARAQHVSGQYNVEDDYSLWPEWTASTEYAVGDKVKVTTISDGVTTVTGYICDTAHTSEESFSGFNWQLTDDKTCAVIVGNGNYTARSNAYALTWEGTGRYKGDLYVNCNANSTGGNKVATETYVTTAINNASIGSGSGLPTVSASDNGKILQVSSGAWSIITPNFLTSHQDISGKANSADLATVATSGSYADLLNKPDLSVYLTTVPTMVGATSSAAGTAGLAPAPTSADVDKFLAGDGTYKSGGLPMVILSYGNSTWAEFEAAYSNNVIVYARASSNSNPATGSQTRMAFMAYVNNATTPTEVEFQYYRSMSAHSATAMGDQVFVYKLSKTGGWSVTTRDASIKEINVATGSKLGVSWSSNKVTLSNTMTAADMPMSSSDATTVDSAITSLSEQIMQIQSPQNITLNTTDWTRNYTTCFRMGKFVIVNIYVWGTPVGGKTIATGLPKPHSSNEASSALGSSPSLLSVDSNGVLAITSAGSGTYIGGTIAYYMD